MKLHTSPLTTICYIYFACKAEGTSLKYEFISALRLLKDPEMKSGEFMKEQFSRESANR